MSQSPSQQVCIFCANLNAAIIDSPGAKTGPYCSFAGWPSPRLTDVKVSAAKGCESCRFLVDVIAAFYLAPPALDGTSSTSVVVVLGQFGLAQSVLRDVRARPCKSTWLRLVSDTENVQHMLDQDPLRVSQYRSRWGIELYRDEGRMLQVLCKMMLNCVQIRTVTGHFAARGCRTFTTA